jgi:hypothetical protein
MTQYSCDNSQQVRITLSPMKKNGHPATLDAAPTGVVTGGGDALFVGVSPTQVLFVSGNLEVETFFTVTGTSGGVTVSEQHSLLVQSSPLGSLGFPLPTDTAAVVVEAKVPAPAAAPAA